jgi:Fe-S-cluster-containing dehydrogenase component
MSNKGKYGILVDYEYCTGCHSCEVACKKELNLPVGKYGIQLGEIGPWKIDDDHWEWTYMPILTKMCNLCEDRVAVGKLPSCVHLARHFVWNTAPSTI